MYQSSGLALTAAPAPAQCCSHHGDKRLQKAPVVSINSCTYTPPLGASPSFAHKTFPIISMNPLYVYPGRSHWYAYNGSLVTRTSRSVASASVLLAHSRSHLGGRRSGLYVSKEPQVARRDYAVDRKLDAMKTVRNSVCTM